MLLIDAGDVRWFSPHTRGCSRAPAAHGYDAGVFPAYAGMFRVRKFPPRRLGSFPRIRGDVPPQAFSSVPQHSFSPHTRGCSAGENAGAHYIEVFPAYAGMFRHVDSGEPVVWGFPRIRGDVPHE